MNISKEAEQLRQKEDELKAQLVAKILEQPQNPDINIQKDSSVMAFTVKSSTVFSNNLILSPFYYDWRQQAVFAAELVNNGKTLSTSLKHLRTIAATGKLRVGGNTYVFHPAVCKRLLEIIS